MKKRLAAVADVLAAMILWLTAAVILTKGAGAPWWAAVIIVLLVRTLWFLGTLEARLVNKIAEVVVATLEDIR